MSETKLDVFKVEYSFWKDVAAIAVGITIADIVAFLFKVGLVFFLTRH
jgi:hypothetical protein